MTRNFLTLRGGPIMVSDQRQVAATILSDESEVQPSGSGYTVHKRVLTSLNTQVYDSTGNRTGNRLRLVATLRGQQHG